MRHCQNIDRQHQHSTKRLRQINPNLNSVAIHYNAVEGSFLLCLDFSLILFMQSVALNISVLNVLLFDFNVTVIVIR